MDFQTNNYIDQMPADKEGQVEREHFEPPHADHDRHRRKASGKTPNSTQARTAPGQQPAGGQAGPSGASRLARRRSIGRVAACWAGLAATVACNGAFEALKLGGVTASDVSNQVFTWFMPAGYVFSIWGVIYVSLAAWMIFETKRAWGGRALNSRQTALFLASCALNIAWLAVFHLQLVALSLPLLVALWVVLALLYVSFRDDETRSLLNLAPFSLYFGWSTVALIVNSTNLATRIFAAPLLANQISTIVLTVAVLVVAFLSARNSRDYVFPLVAIWALVGVGVHLASTDFLVSTAVLALTALGAVVVYLPQMLKANRRSWKVSAD